MSKRKKQAHADQSAALPDDADLEPTSVDLQPGALPPEDDVVPGDDEPTLDSIEPTAPGAEASDEPWADVSIEAPAADEEFLGGWEEPTRVGEAGQLAELAAQSAVEPGEAEAAAQAWETGQTGEQTGDDQQAPVDSEVRLESILESLLFAADRPLALGDLKRLVNERDGKKLSAALDALQARHQATGIHLASAAGGWQFRTNPENAVWVAKLIAGRPARLSRAMLETLAIVAYRQPITRPEIDEIRGVDCGPVLKTLLDRALIRMIGKKEEVGRPILYGTSPEFLRTFSLKDLTELPTLRQFHELGVAEQAKVDAETPARAGVADGQGASPDTGAPRAMPAPSRLPDHDPDEEDTLLAELDDATALATRATRSAEPIAPPPAPEAPAPEAAD